MCASLLCLLSQPQFLFLVCVPLWLPWLCRYLENAIAHYTKRQGACVKKKTSLQLLPVYPQSLQPGRRFQKVAFSRAQNIVCMFYRWPQSTVKGTLSLHLCGQDTCFVRMAIVIICVQFLIKAFPHVINHLLSCFSLIGYKKPCGRSLRAVCRVEPNIFHNYICGLPPFWFWRLMVLVCGDDKNKARSELSWAGAKALAAPLLFPFPSTSCLLHHSL